MNIISYAIDRSKKYHRWIFIVIIFIIFIYLGYNAYSRYEGFDSKSEKKKYQDVANAQDFTPTVQLYMFFVDWCPHCKTAKPEWDKIKLKYNNTEVGGYLVECIDIDCTDDFGEVTLEKSKYGAETPTKISEIIKQYDINGYPTVKLVKEGKPYDFEAKITEPNLNKFIDQILNE